MSLKDEALGLLTHLGLTPLQAEVYLTICKFEKATVKTCAKTMRIARAEIYRAIPDLERRGLVRRVISTPANFIATPIADGLSILQQLNTLELNNIKAKTNEFIKKINRNNLKETKKEEPQYILTVEVAHNMREFRRVMNSLRISLDCIINWPRLKYDVLTYGELFKRAIDRGAKCRFITHLSKGEIIPERFHILNKAGSFKMKYTSTPPPTIMAIIDKKETATFTSQEGCMGEQTILWSNDPRLIATYQDYFKLKWQSATTLDSTRKTSK